MKSICHFEIGILGLRPSVCQCLVCGLRVCVMDQLINTVFYLKNHAPCASEPADSGASISWLRGWEMSHMLLISFTFSFKTRHSSFIHLIFTNVLFHFTLFQQYIYPFLPSMSLCLTSTSPASSLSFISLISSQFTSYIDILSRASASLLLSSIILISYSFFAGQPSEHVSVTEWGIKLHHCLAVGSVGFPLLAIVFQNE